MSKVAVVYWSSTGNTEAMADAVVEGAKEKGADVTLYECADFRPEMVGEYDAIAFGCPAMGDEVLEEDEFEPMFDGCKAELKDKKIALFGSYGWGDGEWMRNWVARMEEAGAQVYGGEDAICMNEPDSEAEEKLEALGKELAAL
jgi:flavodoxin I